MASVQDASPARFDGASKLLQSLVGKRPDQPESALRVVAPPASSPSYRKLTAMTRSADLFDQLKADVRVTRHQRKTSAAAALQILFVTAQDSPKCIYLSSLKSAGLTAKNAEIQPAYLFRLRNIDFGVRGHVFALKREQRRFAGYRCPAAQGAARFQPAGRTGPKALPA